MLLAVMDLGSNSFKMTVAQWDPQASPRHPFRILHKERHPIQLGGSVFANGRISDKDFKEGLKAIEKMQFRLRDFASPILRVVATSAIRDSVNGRDFVHQVKTLLGIPIEVISGAEEARLIRHGLTLEYPAVKRGLLIDIGGGSTEVACFGGSWKDPFCHSFKLGSVRLATKFFGAGNKPLLANVRKFVAASLKFSAPHTVEKLVGSAGTIQSLGEILTPSRTIREIKLTALDAWIKANFSKPASHFVKNHDLTPSRARVVIPGAVILSEVLHWLKQDSLVVTGMTLRDGLMVDLVEKWQASEKRILKGVVPASESKISPKQTERQLLKFLEATAQRFHVDLSHANHIAGLALSVFDQMAQQGFSFSAEDRRILMVAAYLHDIGQIISDGAHQKHSCYIIRNLRIPEFSPLDCKMAALVALYHRKEPPPKKDLPDEVKGVHAEQVRRLSAILRLADGLDETHTQAVRAVKLRFSKKQALLELMQRHSTRMNLDYFRDKAAYFEEFFDVKVVSFVQSNPLKPSI